MHGWSWWGDQDWKEFHNKKTHTAAAGEWAAEADQNNNAAQADQTEQSTASATTRPADSAAVRAQRYACLDGLPAHVFQCSLLWLPSGCVVRCDRPPELHPPPTPELTEQQHKMLAEMHCPVPPPPRPADLWTGLWNWTA